MVRQFIQKRKSLISYSVKNHIDRNLKIVITTVTFEIIDMDGQRIDKLLVKISEELKEDMEDQGFGFGVWGFVLL